MFVINVAIDLPAAAGTRPIIHLHPVETIETTDRARVVDAFRRTTHVVDETEAFARSKAFFARHGWTPHPAHAG